MPRGPIIWHVWRWNGEAFDLVWHDLPTPEARERVEWANDRFESQGVLTRYVAARDGMDPVPPT